MTSSPIPAAARSQYLLELLAQVPDPRKRRGIRHPLAGLLAVGVAAVIAGARSFAAVGQWAADAGPEALAALGAARGPAEESTFRRAFALVSADVLDQVLGAWLWTRAARPGGRLVIAVDGKAVRGAKGKNGKAPDAQSHPRPARYQRLCRSARRPSDGRLQAGTRCYRSPSVAVRETADGAHRPSPGTNPVRHASVDTATQRSTATQGDTPRDREETPR
jgi:hypothetical protein